MNNLFAAADSIRSHANKSGLQKNIFTDPQTRRITRLLLTSNDGWKNLRFTSKTLIDKEGYLLVNWRRLNLNIIYKYADANVTYNNRTIEEHPFLFRHRYNSDFTNVFLLSHEPIHRGIVDITTQLKLKWLRFEGSAGRWAPLKESSEIEVRGHSMVATGYDFRHSRSSDFLPGGHFVEVVFNAQARGLAVLRADLHWSRDTKNYTGQYMGVMYANETPREMALWTYLPDNAKVFRLILENSGDSTVKISDVKVYLLESHEKDLIQQKGGAW